jgi:hypothetical protein
VTSPAGTDLVLGLKGRTAICDHGNLQATLDAGGPTGRLLAELGIGTNPGAILTGHIGEDEKAVGTVHLAFGTSASIGGTNVASVHIDGKEITGRLLAKLFPHRDDYVLATKVYFPMGSGPNDRGLARKHLVAAVDASLNRLGTDYVEVRLDAEPLQPGVPRGGAGDDSALPRSGSGTHPVQSAGAWTARRHPRAWRRATDCARR